MDNNLASRQTGVVKFYVANICGNQHVKKLQIRAQMIMESKGVAFETIDITAEEMEAEKKFMLENASPRANGKIPVPPQFFNQDEYLGDYEDFAEAIELNRLEDFLKVPIFDHEARKAWRPYSNIEKSLSPIFMGVTIILAVFLSYGIMSTFSMPLTLFLMILSVPCTLLVFSLFYRK
uniref:EOG090X0DPU n=1 Tax=Evadne anonyx TaxID=141404 RepID=A0A9N6WTD8_9CRUS|nr:EOG090X0DPU [Evadne anonyx]